MSSTLASSLQAIVATVLIIALIFALAWVARRFTGGTTPGGLMRVRSATAVGARERVVIVEIGEQWLVLGVASGQVNLLATLPRGETPPAPDGGSFLARLNQAKART